MRNINLKQKIKENAVYFLPFGLLYKGYKLNREKGNTIKVSLSYGLGLEVSRLGAYVSPIPGGYTFATLGFIKMVGRNKNLEGIVEKSNL